MANGKGVIIYPISRGREANFVFFVADPNPWLHNSNTVECSKEEMVADLRGFDQRLIKLLDWAKPLRWAIHHMRNTPTYFNRRVCLLGDVAHASSPHQAAGAGQGLEDAVVLTHLLSLVTSVDQVGAAFQAYDAVRRPRASRVVQTSYEAGLMYQFQDPNIEDDLQKIVQNANQRLHWIWNHDLERDIQAAEDMFRSSLSTQITE